MESIKINADDTWAAGNSALRKLMLTNNYAHAMHYWNVLKESNGSLNRMDDKTFELGFELFEKVGSPWDVIDNYQYLKRIMTPNDYHKAFTIKAYCALGMLNEALELNSSIRDKFGLQRALCPIIELCLKKGSEDFETAKQLVASIPLNERKVASYDIEFINTVIMYRWKIGETDSAISLYKNLLETRSRDEHFEPSSGTFFKVMRIYIDLVKVEEFMEVVLEFENYKNTKERIFQQYIEDSFYRPGKPYPIRNVPLEDKETFRNLLLEMYATSGDIRVLEYIHQITPESEHFVTDAEAKYYRDLILNYAATGGPLKLKVDEYIRTNAQFGLTKSEFFPDGKLTHNRKILEDFWLSLFPESKLVPPVFDPYVSEKRDPITFKKPSSSKGHLDIRTNKKKTSTSTTSTISNGYTKHTVTGTDITDTETKSSSESQSKTKNGSISEDDDLAEYRKEQEKRRLIEEDFKQEQILNLQLGKFKRKHPTLYQRLETMYKNEQGKTVPLDSGTISQLSQDAYKSTIAQINTVEKFLGKNRKSSLKDSISPFQKLNRGRKDFVDRSKTKYIKRFQ
jgi:tetratricopeptide (TPR) repeat protein